MLSTKTIVIAGASIAAAAGLALLGASSAGAEQSTATAASYGYGHGPERGARAGADGGERSGDLGMSQLRDEQLLTGENADRVAVAATVNEPDATVERVETDSDGVYSVVEDGPRGGGPGSAGGPDGPVGTTGGGTEVAG